MAGLWSTGKGKITFYVKDGENPPEVRTKSDMKEEHERAINRNSRGIFFLPQRPYMVLGTLRQQLLYPTWAEDAITNSDSAEPTGTYLNYFPMY